MRALDAHDGVRVSARAAVNILIPIIARVDVVAVAPYAVCVVMIAAVIYVDAIRVIVKIHTVGGGPVATHRRRRRGCYVAFPI